MSNGKNKKASFGQIVIEAKKEAVITPGASFNALKACWRVGNVQMVAPYGFHELPSTKIQYIRSKLAEFEKRTWNEIFVIDKKHNHSVAVSGLKCPIAKKWLRDHMSDLEEISSLRLTGTERIWGIFAEGAFTVLWWDPYHLIWKTEK